jgi:hypothetical protein
MKFDHLAESPHLSIEYHRNLLRGASLLNGDITADLNRTTLDDSCVDASQIQFAAQLGVHETPPRRAQTAPETCCTQDAEYQ